MSPPKSDHLESFKNFDAVPPSKQKPNRIVKSELCVERLTIFNQDSLKYIHGHRNKCDEIILECNINMLGMISDMIYKLISIMDLSFQN